MRDLLFSQEFGKNHPARFDSNLSVQAFKSSWDDVEKKGGIDWYMKVQSSKGGIRTKSSIFKERES
jgi:hypothetical protein